MQQSNRMSMQDCALTRQPCRKVALAPEVGMDRARRRRRPDAFSVSSWKDGIPDRLASHSPTTLDRGLARKTHQGGRKRGLVILLYRWMSRRGAGEGEEGSRQGRCGMIRGAQDSGIHRSQPMTVLHRTDLTTPQKIECAAAAVARQHEHGANSNSRWRGSSLRVAGWSRWAGSAVTARASAPPRSVALC